MKHLQEQLARFLEEQELVRSATRACRSCLSICFSSTPPSLQPFSLIFFISSITRTHQFKTADQSCQGNCLWLLTGSFWRLRRLTLNSAAPELVLFHTHRCVFAHVEPPTANWRYWRHQFIKLRSQMFRIPNKAFSIWVWRFLSGHLLLLHLTHFLKTNWNCSFSSAAGQRSCEQIFPFLSFTLLFLQLSEEMLSSISPLPVVGMGVVWPQKVRVWVITVVTVAGNDACICLFTDYG